MTTTEIRPGAQTRRQAATQRTDRPTTSRETGRGAAKRPDSHVRESAVRDNVHPAAQRQSAVVENERSPRANFVLAVLVLIVTGMVGLVMLNTVINEDAFELHQLNKDQKELDMRERELQRDLAELESPGSLHAAAKRNGLVEAGPPAFIDLESGEVRGKPRPAGS